MPNAPAIIEIECNKIAHGIELVFKDNGMGIDMTKFGNKLFGLYKRFHNHVPGTGVGLYLVKCHIEALGGHINLFSKVAQGTKIFIYLPN